MSDPARILIIEDNPTNLDLMVYLLNAFGYVVLTAIDGELGVAAARSERPDLVVCDVQLPKLDGYGVVAQLRDDRALQHLPIIAVTALAMVGDRSRILSAGFDGYISKPITPETFVRDIEKFLPAERRSQVDPSVARERSEPAAVAKSSQENGLTILVVDDTPANIEFARSTLGPSGYKVFTAANVGDALVVATQKKPDLVLCDLHMLPQSGNDLLELAKRHPWLCQIPLVIISSTYTREGDRVTVWNSGAEHLYGWAASEAIGRPLRELIFVETTEREALLQHLVAAGEFHGEIKHRAKDGREVIVAARVTLIRNDDGTPRSVLGINTDITDRKKLEMQLLRAQRLESIGTLASGVAHDLNNILAPIMMGAGVLRRAKMVAEDEAILSTIETCAHRGADIVRQVLAFARGVEGERVSLNPSHLIEEIVDIAKQTFPKSIRITGRYPEDLWPIGGDPTQLHQVLLNLSVNARDAMTAGGTLTLSAENFPVDEHYAAMTPGAKPGPHVRFEVIDTGMGIPRQNINKIFDPFFSTKELGHGTGLGLSSVIGIVKSHAGFITVDSEVGRGTTFKVYLPAKVDEPQTSKEKGGTVLPRAKGELLLLVDDEKPILQVAKALLEDHGYHVLTADDATEALAIFAIRRDEIKLVLTDLSMPLLDGISLIRTLQKMKPDVRVIASSGRGGQEQHANELASLNMHFCLTKPYNKNELLKALHEALNHHGNQP